MEAPLTLSRRTIAVRRVDPVDKWRKKRLHSIAAIANVLLLSSFCNASAADPYDGQWNGSATAAQGSRCKVGNVTVTVLAQEVIGEAKFGADARNINGTVRHVWRHDRLPHLVGKFNEDKFEGAFQSFECDDLFLSVIGHGLLRAEKPSLATLDVRSMVSFAAAKQCRGPRGAVAKTRCAQQSTLNSR